MKLAISKKILAIAVVFALLLSAVFAIPTSAEEATPVKVKPIRSITTAGASVTNSHKINGGAGGSSVVKPSSGFLTNAMGLNFTLNAKTVTDSNASSGNNLLIYPTAEYFAGNDGLMIYVNVPKASSLLLWIKGSNNKWFHTKTGAPVYLLEEGATEWTELTLANTANTHGLVKFGETGFKGYVKIPFTSIANINTTTSMTIPANFYFTQIQMMFSNYSGTLNVTAGPLYLVTEDSSSADIVDTTYVHIPNEVTPVNKIPATDYKDGADISVSLANVFLMTGYSGQPKVSIPLDFSMSRGVKCGLADAADIVLTNGGITSVNNKFTFFNTATTLAGSAGLMFYIETDKAVSFAPWIYMTGGTVNDYAYIGLGKTYYFLGENSMMWKAGTTATGTTRGIINLEAGFKGLIKVPFASLASLNGKLSDQNCKLGKTEFYFANYEGVATVTAGPMFVLNKSTESPYVKDRTTGITPVKGNFVAVGAHEDGCKGPVDIHNVLLSDGVNAFGVKVTAASSSDKCNSHKNDATEIAKNGYLANSQIRIEYRQASGSKIAADQNGLMFYVKTTAANQVLLEMAISGLENFVLISNASYEVLPVGATEWTEKKTINGYDDASKNPYNAYGALNFEEAFEGYVRIPFESFLRYASVTGGFGGKSVELLHIKMKGIGVGSVTGTNYGEATFGPIMFYDIPDDAVNMKTRLTVAEGDVNDDMVVNLCDIVYFANYMNGSERYPVMADAINFGTDNQDRYVILRQNRLNAITSAEFQ